ncbi:Fic family protein [Pseudoflavitalea rhizosphaerae]|uniref:Fic family protein n=1 Tax=Pseudoflavitalea rhizosphaerae TaxID=1884793 RepID=UPI0019D30C6B|nr:Fic/DOC family N-terminal domain-containing protein [Pseudoflavitalea rhizosphaerae]
MGRWNNQCPVGKGLCKVGGAQLICKPVPSTDLYIQLHVTKEAVESSKIEGTRTQIDEALLPEDEIQPERRSGWIEVNNYVRALYGAVRQLDKLPLSSRLLRQAHKIPFLDGNGRIGRLLIPLYLISTGILKKPLLYLSVYFEKTEHFITKTSGG